MIKVLRTLAAIFVVVCVSSCRTAPVSPSADALVAQAFVRAGVLEIVITNPSEQFVCLPASALDTTQGNLTLKHPDGAPVEVKSRANSAQRIELGFDFADSYFLLAPHERRTFHVGLQNFMVRAGAYNYDLLFPYFVCADVVDTRRVRDMRSVSTHILQASGSLSIDQESR